MSDVQFEEESVLVDQASYRSRDMRSGLVKLVMKTGIVKTESQANYILIGTMFLCVLATMYVIAQYIL